MDWSSWPRTRAKEQLRSTTCMQDTYYQPGMKAVLLKHTTNMPELMPRKYLCIQYVHIAYYDSMIVSPSLPTENP